MLLSSGTFYDESASGGTTGSAETASQPETSSAPASATTEQSSSSAGATDTVSASEVQPGALPTTQAPAAQTLFDRLRQRHQIDYSHKYKSEDELIDGLVNASRLVGKRDQFAEIGRLYEQHLPQFQDFLKAQQQPQQQAAPAQPKNWWEPPEWNESWNAYLDPATGQPIENAPLDVRTAFQKRHDFYDRHRHNLVHNFPEAMKPVLSDFEEKILERVEKKYAEREQQIKLRTEADSLRDQNARWLYYHDPNGRVLTDEVGRRLLTPEGQTFVGHIATLNQLGVQDQQKAVELATLLTQRDMGMMTAAQQAAAAPLPAPGAPGSPIPRTAMQTANSNAGRAPNGQKIVRDDAGLSLRERLRKNFDGIPDASFKL